MLSNLTKRVITALIIFPLVISTILYQNDLLVRLLLNIIIFLAAFELSKMCLFSESGNKSFIFITFVFISIFLSNILIKNNLWNLQIIFSTLIWIYIIFNIIKLDEIHPKKIFNNYYMFLFVILLSSLYCSLYTLYLINYESLIYLICLISICDIAAYFSGKTFGKNSFFSIISPKKTKEGFYGSLIICGLFSILFCAYQNYDFIFSTKLLSLSLFICIIATFGDLSVSLLKRMTDKKDSGKILPGHGGILDRIDSLLPSAPIFLIFSHSLSVII